MSFSLLAYEKLTPAEQLFVVVDLEVRFSARASCPGGAGELAMGAGHAGDAAGYGESDTVVLADVCGTVPSDGAFTWPPPGDC